MRLLELRRRAERDLGGDLEQARQVREAVLVDDVLGAHDGVLVLGGRRREHLETVGQGLAERRDLLLDVRRLGLARDATRNASSEPVYSGTRSTSPLSMAPKYDLAGADAELVADVEAGGRQRLAVDLGEQLALREVGRADDDRTGLAGRRARTGRR